MASEMAASDLLDVLWTISDYATDKISGLVAGIADLLDNDEKRTDLRSAWNEFRSEVIQFLAQRAAPL